MHAPCCATPPGFPLRQPRLGQRLPRRSRASAPLGSSSLSRCVITSSTSARGSRHTGRSARAA
eukprot:4613732-Lingulodinium_polyedra.AAC.1